MLITKSARIIDNILRKKHLKQSRFIKKSKFKTFGNIEMKILSKKIIVLAISVIMIILETRCSQSPTEPYLDLEDEASMVPWSKIMGKIAYSRIGSQSDGYLFLIDGSTRKVNLVRKGDREMFTNLAWSTDGEKIIYSDFDYTRHRWQLYRINSDGGNRSFIYSTDAHNNYPSCSRDGRVAYWYNGFHHIYEIWIDGVSFFGKAGCDQTRPAWSPDNKYLIISFRDSTSQGALYKVSLNDTTFLPLMQGSGNNQEIFHSPIYSPDGSRIAFIKWGPGLGGLSEIWIINANGTNLLRLTSGYKDLYPAWSPDGQKIAFTRNWKIYIMNSDGSDITQVTKNFGSYPIWTQ
jgi:Tol biopolymer transport system component